MNFAERPSERENGRRRHAASHQRSWLWGRHAVLETLQAGWWPVDEIYLADDLPPEADEQIVAMEGQQQLPLPVRTSAGRLSKLCGSDDHQGYLARMAEFPCGTAADWEQYVVERTDSFRVSDDMGGPSRPPLFVICDRIQDAHNFGAILRCCDGAGVDGVLIESRQQASVTPHVARSSAGAVNYLRVFRVDELLSSVEVLQKQGVRIAAASEKADQVLWKQALTGAVAVVIGSESRGIRDDLLSVCEQKLQIPMLGHVSSLNAAVAAGILLYEVRRQQA
jgi:23S rRNA (guanosine2251-2'-O)-methyltransferase